MAEQGQFAQYAQGVNVEEHNVDPGTEGSAPASAPAATKRPQDMSPEELAKISGRPSEGVDKTDEAFSVGVLVIADGKILAGTRHNDFGYGLICGPGGHGEDGETPEQAAIRETQEEFGITPTELVLLGRGPKENETDLTPYLFLCTDYTGVPECMDLEMVNPRFLSLEELGDLDASLFPPFADSLNVLQGILAGVCDRSDGGPGSGNFGHKGVEGQRGGSAPSAQKWRESVGEKRAAMHSEKPNKQAMALWKNGFLDKDTAVAKMKDGSISAEVDRYFDVLEANGDPTPIKKTVTQQRSLASLVDTEYGGDWEKARIGEVAKDTGMTQEEAEKTYRELDTWTGSNWSRANSDMLDGYIEKAPTFDGPIFRGLHFTDSDDYDSFMESISSGVVTMGGNSSWSSDESVARRFAHAIDDDVSSVVIRCVANKTAAPIEHITQKGGEDEVIAHSRAAWTVLDVSEYSNYSGSRKAVVTVIERGEFEDE